MNEPTLFTPPTTRGPQHWVCTACRLTYTSPLPLQHPPNHRCAPPGGPMRIRKMIETAELP